MDALETFPPEDGLAQLKRLHKELGDAITSWEGPSKASDAPNTPPRQVRAGILANPWKGVVDRVEKRTIPLIKGGSGLVFKIHTGAAMFETYSKPWAIQAHYAAEQGIEIQIKWKPRVKNGYTNYDIVALRVLDPHGRTQL